MAAEEGARAGRWSGVWAPLAAGLLIAVLYWPMVDSAFYFLFGREAQGLLLGKAVAEGRGFVDLALPGHPAHVREPPLFYLSLAALIKVFGFRMFPLKVFMWLGYAGTAAAGTWLFQRRGRPWLGAAAMVLVLSSPQLFRFFTGPKSDLPFAAISLVGLAVLEMTLERLPGRGPFEKASPGRPGTMAALAGTIISAAFLTRSIGLALAAAAPFSLLLYRRREISARHRLIAAAWLFTPILVALGFWTVRNRSVSNPAGYNYLDWFRMDLAPDSPEMTAADFHAPLLAEPKRLSFPAALRRSMSHAWFYLQLLPGVWLEPLYARVLSGQAAAWSARAGPLALCLVLLILAGLGLVREEAKPPVRFAVPFYLIAYLAVISLWPMSDPRLLYPLFPLAVFYFLSGLELIALKVIARGASGLKEIPSPRNQATSQKGAMAVVALTVLAALTANIYTDVSYHLALDRLPRESLSPGFDVRFTSREGLASYQLLAWARQNLAPSAVLMYHSPPPCRLVSGHECVSIPYSPDPAKVREYLLTGPADYLVLDEWAKFFPEGAGRFVPEVLRPAVRAFPGDFQKAFSIPGTESGIMRILKTRQSPAHELK